MPLSTLTSGSEVTLLTITVTFASNELSGTLVKLLLFSFIRLSLSVFTTVLFIILCWVLTGFTSAIKLLISS